MKTFTLVISLCTLFFTAACKDGNIQDRLNNPSKYFPEFDEPGGPPPDEPGGPPPDEPGGPPPDEPGGPPPDEPGGPPPDEPGGPPPEGPSLVISPDSLAFVEGGSETFTVALSSEPSAGPEGVTVNMSLNPPDVVMITPSSLTFTPGNYNTAQTVTVTTTDDTKPEPVQMVTITIGYIYPKSVAITITDNDCDPANTALQGAGIEGSPYLVCARDHLEMIGDSDENRSAHYIMTESIDLGGAAFTPISGSFTGTFDGGGFKIQDLAINVSGDAGLFSRLGTGGVIQNLGLENVNIVGTNSGNNNIGSLVANMAGGTIQNCYMTDSDPDIDVQDTGTGMTSAVDSVGGLVGRQSGGRIISSYATGDVSDASGIEQPIGGLVGLLSGGGRIIASYAEGDVRGVGTRNSVGGLVGSQIGGRIIGSYATGDVSVGGGAGTAGGLVGWQNSGNSRIIASYATGTVNGGMGGLERMGGLVGLQTAGRVLASYATGNVNGFGADDQVGGLVGRQVDARCYIITSYATGDVDAGGGTDLGGSVVGAQGPVPFDNYRDNHGFGTVTDAETPGAGSSPPGTVTANDLTSGNTGNRWNSANSPWDYGTASQPPALRYITNATVSGSTVNYSCEDAATILPAGIVCGTTLLPGQGR